VRKLLPLLLRSSTETPPFGFNAQDELQYRGRLDASRMTPVANARRDLFEAMKHTASDQIAVRSKLGLGPHIDEQFLGTDPFRNERRAASFYINRARFTA
jgi:hypothetical protein